MPDFDATEGYTDAGDCCADSGAPKNAGSSDAGTGEPSAGEQHPPRQSPLERKLSNPFDPGLFVPSLVRTREHSAGRLHFVKRPVAEGATVRRLTPPPLAQRRRLARRACPFGWRVFLLGSPSLHRRHQRLGATCRRQPPGSPR
ncbi:MAG TPA: hypothetical protein VLJ42_10775 [Solirubrobacteraceae bacterium]|nr:hypothetical protein [Solirubrobacteraceae bacterium]